MKQVEQGIVVSNAQIEDKIFSITLELPKIAEHAVAGQFVQVYLPKGEMLLPRPISISCIDENMITLVYHVVGNGTEFISSLKKGDSLKILGVLGNGFTQREHLNKVALVGGGIGAPPLLQLLKELKVKDKSIDVDVYLGFRSKSILVKKFESLGANVYVATDSGEEGFKGNAVDLIKEKNIDYDEIFSCGPNIMLLNLSNYAEAKNIPCQVCMEERMACGVGACVGCVIKIKSQDSFIYKKVCKDGPVFYSSEVLWNE